EHVFGAAQGGEEPADVGEAAAQRLGGRLAFARLRRCGGSLWSRIPVDGERHGSPGVGSGKRIAGQGAAKREGRRIERRFGGSGLPVLEKPLAEGGDAVRVGLQGRERLFPVRAAGEGAEGKQQGGGSGEPASGLHGETIDEGAENIIDSNLPSLLE